MAKLSLPSHSFLPIPHFLPLIQLGVSGTLESTVSFPVGSGTKSSRQRFLRTQNANPGNKAAGSNTILHSMIPRRILCASLRSSWSPASAICQMSSTASSVSLLQHFWDRPVHFLSPDQQSGMHWNLRDPAVDSEQFKRDLKTYLFAGNSKS